MVLRAVSLSPPVDNPQNGNQAKATEAYLENMIKTERQQKTHEMGENGIRLGEILQRKCMSQKPQK